MVALENMSEEEVRQYGPLPPGQAKRHRGGVCAGSGFRLEPLAPSAGRDSCNPAHVELAHVLQWRVQSLECTWLTVPLTLSTDGTPRTKGTILAHLEPRLSYVPGFLVTFILRISSSFAYTAVKKVRPATLHATSTPNLTPALACLWS